MSVLPKINLGFRTKREHNNLSQDTHTTMDVGYLQPTFCRHIVPGSHTEISIRNICRLSAMNVPTMGRISLRNYIHFVDFSSLWSPFASFKERVNYTYADGVTAIPAKIPYFCVGDMFRHIFQLVSAGINTYSNIYILQKNLVCTLYKNGTLVSSNTDLAAALTIARSHETVPFISRFWCQTANTLAMTTRVTSSEVLITSASTFVGVRKNVITRSNSDFSFVFHNNTDTYQILGKFYGAVKRLRSIFLGCGYSFNPYDDEPQNFLNLLAVYKAYFHRFGISRTTNFLNTNCYKFIKFTSENRFNDYNMYTQNGMYCSNFFADLANICYALPPDYFSVADTTEFRSTETNTGDDFYVDNAYEVGGLSQDPHVTRAWSGSGGDPIALSSSSGISAVAMKMAMRMLPYINKQSIVGRKLVDLLKLDGIEDIHNDQHELTHKLGATRTDISVDTVMSLAGTDDNSLGDFAGRGVGSNRDEKPEVFYYDNKTYGCLLVLSCVVPVSGYFQGILKENSDGVGGPFDFFTPEFDCLGYQPVKINELVSDLQFQNSTGGSKVGTNLGTWGVIPRYSHLKLGFNRCMGDISLPSTQAVMLPYTLDRHFLTKVLNSGGTDFETVNIPVNDPESFRKIQGADGYGDYNRIFQYVNGDYDHFICQFVFAVDNQAPMKSMKNSFDTFADIDNASIERQHE